MAGARGAWGLGAELEPSACLCAGQRVLAVAPLGVCVPSPPTADKQTACDMGGGKQGLVALCPGLVCGPHDVGVVSDGLGLLLQDGGQDPPHLGAGHA